MKRTIEIVLGSVGTLFNLIAIAIMGLIVKLVSEVKNNTQLQDELVTEFKNQLTNDPQFKDTDIQAFAESMVSAINFLGPFGWFIIICFIVSVVAGIVGIVQAVRTKNRANFAGSMFIVAGVFAGILSLTSIVYYIAAIMCYVRKPKAESSDVTYPNSSVI
ncbi:MULTISPECIES: DUF4064 domain-containing protein [unclassified Rummeliibacillus]|uniref:DUF4064 domain-containing protein n=1 Tax=unclassified Rummeliibacillus TaxID=2622809 RepID=UPI000E67423C|nr:MULTISPECIES: DUF4064 domain-containing protein [unclassified Rummeliibacillus]RIJ64383.1 DUF4064 domain-containing protein [Rummeliibacillus sp. POC4]RPJ96547.1 DUF4064 domain-containing protein [Rummeliibacillus sp. TYF005]